MGEKRTDQAAVQHCPDCEVTFAGRPGDVCPCCGSATPREREGLPLQRWPGEPGLIRAVLWTVIGSRLHPRRTFEQARTDIWTKQVWWVPRVMMVLPLAFVASLLILARAGPQEIAVSFLPILAVLLVYHGVLWVAVECGNQLLQRRLRRLTFAVRVVGTVVFGFWPVWFTVALAGLAGGLVLTSAGEKVMLLSLIVLAAGTIWDNVIGITGLAAAEDIGKDTAARAVLGIGVILLFLLVAIVVGAGMLIYAVAGACA